MPNQYTTYSQGNQAIKLKRKKIDWLSWEWNIAPE